MAVVDFLLATVTGERADWILVIDSGDRPELLLNSWIITNAKWVQYVVSADTLFMDLAFEIPFKHYTGKDLVIEGDKDRVEKGIASNGAIRGSYTPLALVFFML